MNTIDHRAQSAQNTVTRHAISERRTVIIPLRDTSGRVYVERVAVTWRCPLCGGPRGAIYPAQRYGIPCDGWDNPCGHVDCYESVLQEAELSCGGV